MGPPLIALQMIIPEAVKNTNTLQWGILFIMLALVQRVSSAAVKVDGREVSSIGPGLLVFLGVLKGDTEHDLEYLVRKVSQLRVIEDDEGKMNLSLLDTGGEALVVSQFTLAAETRKGNRPSFVNAEEPGRAREMYESFIEGLGALGVNTGSGVFGEMMDVSLVNDGPVTIILDSRG
jgi:D-tyrosyl-tRNA(Tyr) deacylase